MRLLSAEIRGYGRLVNTKVNLDSKVIAVVGPNEAGKTTLLKALAHVDSDTAVNVTERSRATSVSDSTQIVTAYFSLDDADRAVVADLDLEQAPKTMSASRPAGGGAIQIGIQPEPRKSMAALTDAVAAIRRALASEDLTDLVDPETTYADPGGDAPRDYRAELSAVADGIDALLAGSGDAPEHEQLAGQVRLLRDSTLEDDGDSELRGRLSTVEAWCVRNDPAQEVRNRLWNRTADFLLFDEEDRTLQSVYTLDDALLANVPAALANLASMATLDLNALHQYMASGDIARRETAIAKANTELETIFAESWKQSKLTVRIVVDGQDIRVVIWEDGDNVTVFSERSAGLRMFIALMAFLKVRGHARPPILLIDEAENHLHIDAQADLVNMFMTQDQAVKVIYTTHSPACLPPDLGSGIRAVVPRDDNLQISDIKNSFWQSGAGYSPLMLAMGAAAAAFTPARCVVLAEGATEMILLPTLIRVATDEDSLPYQVAPGLSEVPKDFYPKLDLEGAKVAYVLDGDAGGRELEKSLIKAGVPKDPIVSIGVSGIENLLEPAAYREAIESLLRERPTSEDTPELPALGEPAGESWAQTFKKWFEAHHIDQPSKVAVANWLVEHGKATPSASGRKLLKKAHNALLRAVDHEGPADDDTA